MTPDAGRRPVLTEVPDGRPSPWRWPLLAVVIGFAAFWIWALFFASKEAVNRIGDDAWAARAEEICLDARASLEDLADFRPIDADDPALLAERADLVDRATDVVEGMLNDVVAQTPADDKGAAIVPQWEADYRTYLANRRTYAERVRGGENATFSESVVDGIPISEKLETFAGDNEMPACAPPRDL